MKCVVCERDTEGSIEITLEIKFPITGSVSKGVMHLPCAIHALTELRGMYLDKVKPESVSKPS